MDSSAQERSQHRRQVGRKHKKEDKKVPKYVQMDIIINGYDVQDRHRIGLVMLHDPLLTYLAEGKYFAQQRLIFAMTYGAEEDQSTKARGGVLLQSIQIKTSLMIV